MQKNYIEFQQQSQHTYRVHTDSHMPSTYTHAQIGTFKACKVTQLAIKRISSKKKNTLQITTVCLSPSCFSMTMPKQSKAAP